MTGGWRERARERVGEQVEADMQQLIEEETDQPAEPRTLNGVGMPAAIRLDAFGMRIHDAFGHLPYLVGSAAVSKKWRDVDVRLMLDDDVFDALFPQHHGRDSLDLRWALFCDAIAELGRQQTGLPIDFQIQRLSDANRKYQGVRIPLGLRLTD